MINVTQCQSIELMALNDVLNENLDILNDNTNNSTRDLTIMFDITEVELISRDVNSLTDVSTGIVPNDINETNSIVSSLIRWLCIYIICDYYCMYIHTKVRLRMSLFTYFSFWQFFFPSLLCSVFCLKL